MRFIKIVLIIFPIFLLLGAFNILWEDFSNDRVQETPVLAYVLLGLVMFFSVLNLLYHLKSFRFFRKKEKQQLHKKLPKVYWISAISLPLLVLAIIGFIFSTVGFRIDQLLMTKDMFIFLSLVLPSLLGLLEVSLLKKRIKRLKTELNLKDEISAIGNSNT